MFDGRKTRGVTNPRSGQGDLSDLWAGGRGDYGVPGGEFGLWS